MAKCVLLPLIERGDFLPEEILGVVGHKESAQKTLSQLPEGIHVVSADNPVAKDVWKAPVKILAVKPQKLNEIEKNFLQFDQNIPQNSLLISLLAGVPLQKLQITFQGHLCVRAVPNTPVVVKKGLTGLAWGEDISVKQRLLVKEIFNPISEVFEFPEDQLDGFLALTSSGPAYVALMIEALADGAVAAGLPRSIAHYLSHRTLYGTSLLLKEKDMQPSELKDMVTSPGGTTIKALRHLEMAGLRSALIEAVVLAAERSREIGLNN